MDPQVANQFISLKDLVSFPGQMLAVGTIAEVVKRIWTTMPDGLNRLFILAGALVVNFIVTLAHSGLPVGGLAWSSLGLVTTINAGVIALTTMKSIEFIAERKETEIARDLAAGGVQVKTTVAPAGAAAKAGELQAAPLGPLATAVDAAPPPLTKPDVTPQRVPLPKDSS